MSDKKTKKTQRKKQYKHPIPDRNALLDYLEGVGKPVRVDRILGDLGLRGQRMLSLLVDQLNGMVRAGQIIENRSREYCLTRKIDILTGRVIGHRDGFGFVKLDDGGDDVYLSAREMRTVFDGDRIALKVAGYDRNGRPEGDVVDILERGRQTVAGQFIRERGIGLLIPDNPKITHRILIAKGENGGAKHGQMVVAEILDFPTRNEQATGKVVRIIGAPDQKGIATELAIESHGIPTHWPREVVAQAEKYGSTVSPDAKKGRVDLRELELVTIDGADARDFDDAVYCEATKDGWRLIVAIADVAHYVEIESALDKQAITRGTSVYFPDRVVPMLPEALSNGLCSLNPKVDRLCLCCEMQITSAGKIRSSKFFDGVMRSKARLTYSAVADFLETESTESVPQDVHGSVRELHALFQVLVKARNKRGAIEIDVPMTSFVLNDAGEIDHIRSVKRNDAHRLIEECMIAANVEAAKFLAKHKIPGLYRVHARPDEERFDELRLYLTSLGLKAPHSQHVTPKQFNELLQSVKDRPDASAIAMTMIRSLTHAEYTPENIGHFGLALDAYAHFTSPIRRYPDLLVHRAIRHIIRGGKAGKFHYDLPRMQRLGEISSAHERRAEEASREVEAWLKCQFMSDHVGETFAGVITGVKNFGVFVQIPEFQIDGLVHVSNLVNDYYRFEADTQRLVGERSGKAYGLGDALEVLVQKVDMETRRIDFRPAEMPEKTSTRRRRR